MSDVNQFMAENTPSGKQSKLDPYLSEIQTLRDHYYSESDILRFLKEKKGVSVSQPTLNRFIKKHLKIISAANEKKIMKKNESPASTQGNQSRSTNNESGKFNWQEPIEKTDLI